MVNFVACSLFLFNWLVTFLILIGSCMTAFFCLMINNLILVYIYKIYVILKYIKLKPLLLLISFC